MLPTFRRGEKSRLRSYLTEAEKSSRRARLNQQDSATACCVKVFDGICAPFDRLGVVAVTTYDASLLWSFAKGWRRRSWRRQDYVPLYSRRVICWALFRRSFRLSRDWSIEMR